MQAAAAPAAAVPQPASNWRLARELGAGGPRGAIWAGAIVASMPKQTGVAAQAVEVVTSLRVPQRWRDWPGQQRKWVQQLHAVNPLRQQLHRWPALCGGAPGFEPFAYWLQHGLPLCAPQQRPERYDVPNHGSCADPERAPLANAVLQEEAAAGMTAAVGADSAFCQKECHWWHALGTLHKAPGKVRIIHDYSLPAGRSLNDVINYIKLSYKGVDKAFAAMRPGCWLAKIDFEAFFRHIGIDPADLGLTGFRWQGQAFVDMRLNFGQRSAPEVAYRFAMAVLWAVQQRMAGMNVGRVEVLVVCDDWLVVAGSEAHCLAVWRMLMQVLAALGFQFAEHKCTPPCRRLVWLELLLDSLAMTVALPAEKVEKALQLCAAVQTAQKVTRRQLDSLFGFLSWCQRGVWPACIVARRAAAALPQRRRSAQHCLHVHRALRYDMGWCRQHLQLFNGDRATPIVSSLLSFEDNQIFLDARRGPGGVGLFVDGQDLLSYPEGIRARTTHSHMAA